MRASYAQVGRGIKWSITMETRRTTTMDINHRYAWSDANTAEPIAMIT